MVHKVLFYGFGRHGSAAILISAVQCNAECIVTKAVRIHTDANINSTTCIVTGDQGLPQAM